MRLIFVNIHDIKDRAIIALAADFFAQRLMSTRMKGLIMVEIERHSFSDDRIWGDCCQLDGSGSKPTRHFSIRLSPNVISDTDKLLRILAHEMVHVEQGASNRLQKRMYKTDGQWHYRWEGKSYGVASAVSFGTDAYWDAPWEREAYATDTILRDEFKQAFSYVVEF